MPEVVVKLDGDTADQLDVERELLGFDTRSEYLAWIVENRAAIDKGTERERLLTAYEDRIEALERRLDELEALDGADSGATTESAPATPEAEPTASDPTGDQSAAAPSADPADAQQTSPTVDGDGRVADAESTEPAGPTADSEASLADSSQTDAEARGEDIPKADPEAGTAGSSQTDPEPVAASHSTGGTRPARDDPDGEDDQAGNSRTADADSRGLAGVDRIEGTTSVPGESEESVEPSDSAAEAGVESMHLSPERVSRVSEDSVSEDADVLSGVETDRLDELTRRAVAKTRKQLDRDVETGLSYRSSTSLADSEVRPGDDITDLDGLDLPGRSEETLRKRQEAAGHALAFLRDEGRARRSDFVDALYEECPAEYGTEDGWWNCIKEALKQVDAVDGGQGTRVWRFDR